jgi:hypothetical protein
MYLKLNYLYFAIQTKFLTLLLIIFFENLVNFLDDFFLKEILNFIQNNFMVNIQKDFYFNFICLINFQN